jgi:hypothetical protein
MIRFVLGSFVCAASRVVSKAVAGGQAIVELHEGGTQ